MVVLYLTLVLKHLEDYSFLKMVLLFIDLLVFQKEEYSKLTVVIFLNQRLTDKFKELKTITELLRFLMIEEILTDKLQHFH